MKKSVFFITRSALVAAIYFALATALQPVSFGPVQFRLSEALVLLPVFMPESVIGVTLGCFLSNFFYSTMYDVIFGTIATGVAAVLIWVVDGSDTAYFLNFGLILASEVIVVAIIGWPLTIALKKALERAGIRFYSFRRTLSAEAYVRQPHNAAEEDDG